MELFIGLEGVIIFQILLNRLKFVIVIILRKKIESNYRRYNLLEAIRIVKFIMIGFLYAAVI